MSRLEGLSYGGDSIHARNSRSCKGTRDCSCGLKYSRCAGLHKLELAAECEKVGRLEEAKYWFELALECAI